MSSRMNYLGKAAITTPEPNIDIALANPALIEYNTKGKLMASSGYYFTSIYSNVCYSHNQSKYDIPFVFGANVIKYGEQRYIDVNGVEMGRFNPYDLSLYLAASKTYEHYKFGATFKYAYGDYYRAAIQGVAADLSMLYRDDEREMYATLLLKNIGYQFFAFNTETSSMPFDIQLGFSKKLKHFPFRFSVTAQELYKWNTATYTVDGRGYGVWPQNNLFQIQKPGVVASIMSHLIFGGELNFGRGFKVGASYDVKKGMEDQFETFRGMTGFALGFGIYTRKFDFGYSFSKISPISVNHQFTFTMNMKEIIRR